MQVNVVPKQNNTEHGTWDKDQATPRSQSRGVQKVKSAAGNFKVSRHHLCRSNTPDMVRHADSQRLFGASRWAIGKVEGT